MTLNRRTLLGLTAATVALGSSAFAAKPPVFADGGVAINGYDPVAYFTQSEPVKGDAAFTSEWNGASWQFSSAETKAMFDADPEKYAPHYGGYCAYAVSKGYTATTDPDAWSIVDDKLYLNYSKTVRALWRRNEAANIAKADANWPSVLA